MQLWEAVTRLSWCPVLVQPPVTGLPWPAAGQTRAQQRDQDGGSGGRQLQRLPPVAPPRLARPPADLWLVSAGCLAVCLVHPHCRRRLTFGHLQRRNRPAVQLMQPWQRQSGVHNSVYLARIMAPLDSLCRYAGRQRAGGLAAQCSAGAPPGMGHAALAKCPGSPAARAGKAACQGDERMKDDF